MAFYLLYQILALKLRARNWYQKLWKKSLDSVTPKYFMYSASHFQLNWFLISFGG